MNHKEQYHYNGRCYAGLPETNSIPEAECHFDDKPIVLYHMGRVIALDCAFPGHGSWRSEFCVTVEIYDKRIQVPVNLQTWNEMHRKIAQDSNKFFSTPIKLVLE